MGPSSKGRQSPLVLDALAPVVASGPVVFKELDLSYLGVQFHS